MLVLHPADVAVHASPMKSCAHAAVRQHCPSPFLPAEITFTSSLPPSLPPALATHGRAGLATCSCCSRLLSWRPPSALASASSARTGWTWWSGRWSARVPPSSSGASGQPHGRTCSPQTCAERSHGCRPPRHATALHIRGALWRRPSTGGDWVPGLPGRLPSMPTS